MPLSRRAAGFLVAVGVWTWLIWPNFLRQIWGDERSWDQGPTSFLLVHLVLVVTSLLLGTGVGWIGVRAVRPRRWGAAHSEEHPSIDAGHVSSNAGDAEPTR